MLLTVSLSVLLYELKVYLEEHTLHQSPGPEFLPYTLFWGTSAEKMIFHVACGPNTIVLHLLPATVLCALTPRLLCCSWGTRYSQAHLTAD